MKKLFYFLLLVSSFCFADSPLTSITFWQVYQDEAIVKKASMSNHNLTEEIAKYLVQENPIYIKLSVINALGWNVKGQKNSKKFEKYILKEFYLKTINDLNDKSYGNKSDILLCYAYLKAMDNYFDVSESLKITTELHTFNKDDIYYDFVYSLISAQNIMNTNGSFCNIYKEAERLVNTDVKTLMRKGVWEVYSNYFRQYKDYCM